MDGHGIHFDMTGALLLPAIALVFYLCFTLRRRKQAEQLATAQVTELLAANRVLEQEIDDRKRVLDNSVIGIITMNSNSVVTSFNPAAEKLFGYEAQQVVSRNVSILMRDRDGVAHDDYLTNYQTSGKKNILGRARMVIGRHRDGHTIPVELSLDELRIRGDRHFVAFLTDISDRITDGTKDILDSNQALEQEIVNREHLQRHLSQAQKMEAIGESTGGITHDFNNLLMVIDGYAKRALRDMSDMEATGRALEEVIGATAKATKLTRQLLKFSRHTDMEKRVFRAGASVADIEALLQDSAGEGYEVGLDIEDGDACVATDPAELSQALVNLTVNARDAMPNGGPITIGVRTIDADAEFFTRHTEVSVGRYAVISVRDQGTGIEEKALSKIFNSFFTTKEHGEGTGLGLAMVFGFAQHSGGVVDVETAPDRGSTFSIYLPIVDQPPELVAAAEEKEHRGKGETVLLVEDDVRLLELLHDIVKDLGYHVLAASHGLEALEKDEGYEGNIDLLLSDVDMPALDGFELYAMLRERRPDMKVVFISGYPKLEGRSNAAPEGARILQKPVEAGLLARAMRGELESIEERPVDQSAVG